MKKCLFILLVFCIFCPFLSANAQSATLILTSEQNNKWIDSLRTLKLDQQLITIKSRLLADTNVYVRQFYADRIIIDEPLGYRVYGDGKPQIFIENYALVIDNNTAADKILWLTKLLTLSHIKKMSILNGNDLTTQVLYGASGTSGVILMTLTKNKYLKKFKKIHLKSNEIN